MDPKNAEGAGGRRRFLATAALAATGAGAGCGRAGSSWRFFSEDEGETLIALCEQIIPADQDPGARQAETAHYIDRQMLLQFQEFGRIYRDGLAQIDRASRAGHQKRFIELSAVEQTALLAIFEREHAAFFRLAVTHTMQGFYGNPRHGGNRDAASWRMLGIPEPPIRGRLKG